MNGMIEKMTFRYEMHQHTAPCSHCAGADPEKLVSELKKQGMAGCVLTDHFFHGNSGIDRSLPWDEFCRPYEENYLRAKAAGEKNGIDILFGLEEHVGEGKEVLLYGITPLFMYEHPELRAGGLKMIYSLAKECGALVIQAHPFRNRDYIPDPDKTLDAAFLDGYEIINTANRPEDNVKTVERLSSCGKILTAGSDCHRNESDCRAGIETRFRITGEKQLAEVLKTGSYGLFGTGDFIKQ